MTRREVKLVKTNRPFNYLTAFPDEEHTLLVCVVDDSVTDSERARVSADIVDAKCRYAVCWGHHCSAWDDSIDWAYLETDENFNPPDETHVMTTWHEDESIEDAISFWWMNTSFDRYLSTKMAILLVGEDSAMMENILAITDQLLLRWNETKPVKG